MFKYFLIGTGGFIGSVLRYWTSVNTYKIFGTKSVIHKAKFLELSEDLPVLIEIVDSEERITQAIPILDELITKANCGVLMTLEKAEVIKYTSGK